MLSTSVRYEKKKQYFIINCVNMVEAEIDVVVEHLDGDVIDEHLRTSTAVLHDIMGSGMEDKEIATDQDISSCEYCGKIYKTLGTLQKHIQLKHANDECRCDCCDKTYASKLSLEQHARYMHRRQRCTVCYKTFETPKALEVHGEVCRRMEMPCQFCGIMYASAVSLRNHIKYKHPASKTHWCELCRRAFTSDKRLANHRSTVHPPGATVCGCGRSFNSVAALQSHILYKHTEVNARCLHCHKAFMTRSSLKRHLMKLHKVDLAACVKIMKEPKDDKEKKE